MVKLSTIERIVLNETQKGIPLEPRPFRKVAKAIGLTEDEVVKCLVRLKQNGFIRRVGGIFDVQKFGIVSTLVGIKANDNIQEIIKIINEYPGVTHNYQREHEFNIWFTLMAPNEHELEKIFDEIKKKTGVNDIVNLPSICKHKVNVYFSF
ncbi:Lrp/AsnC family transcriptional regulator [Bacillota bacterium LX-D]|nr:Lrp/AsnC family transcriptional regulator [Bacillota bacterium LX-D]